MLIPAPSDLFSALSPRMPPLQGSAEGFLAVLLGLPQDEGDPASGPEVGKVPAPVPVLPDAASPDAAPPDAVPSDERTDETEADPAIMQVAAVDPAADQPHPVAEVDLDWFVPPLAPMAARATAEDASRIAPRAPTAEAAQAKPDTPEIRQDATIPLPVSKVTTALDRGAPPDPTPTRIPLPDASAAPPALRPGVGTEKHDATVAPPPKPDAGIIATPSALPEKPPVVRIEGIRHLPAEPQAPPLQAAAVPAVLRKDAIPGPVAPPGPVAIAVTPHVMPAKRAPLTFEDDKRNGSDGATILEPLAAGQVRAANAGFRSSIPGTALPPASAVVPQIAANVPDTPGTGFELRLEPAELGHVTLKLVRGEHAATLFVTAERPEILDLLRRNIGMLQDDLRQLGHDALNLSFSMGTRHGGGGQPDGGYGRQSAFSAPDPETHAVRSTPILATDRLDLRL